MSYHASPVLARACYGTADRCFRDSAQDEWDGIQEMLDEE